MIPSKSTALISALACLIFSQGCTERSIVGEHMSTGSIAGIVRPAGIDAKVTLLQSQAIRERNVEQGGYFTFEDVPPGLYFLSASAEGYQTFELDYHIEVKAGSRSVIPDITLASYPEPVVLTRPYDGQVRVSPGTDILIRFDSPMDHASVQDAFSIEPPVAGFFQWYIGGDIEDFVFGPNLPLLLNETYTVTVDTTALRSDGAAIESPVKVVFVTEPLTVTYLAPSSGQVDIPMREVIIVEFNSCMDRALTEAAFSVDPPVDGTLYWYSGGAGFYFVPVRPMAGEKTYTVRVGAGARSCNGEFLAEPYESSFRTEPVSVEIWPESGSDIHPSYVSIQLTFNTDMDRASVEESFSMEPEVSGSFEWRGDDAVDFHRGQNLMTGADYTVMITTGAKDRYGTSLGRTCSSWYRTWPLEIDLYLPRDGESYVSRESSVRVDFNTTMNKQSLESAFSITPDHPGHLEWMDDNWFYFRPEASYLPETWYTVRVDTTAADLGGGKLPMPLEFKFKTRP